MHALSFLWPESLMPAASCKLMQTASRSAHALLLLWPVLSEASCQLQDPQHKAEDTHMSEANSNQDLKGFDALVCPVSIFQADINQSCALHAVL